MKGFSILLLCAVAAASFWFAGRMHAPLIDARAAQQVGMVDPMEGTTPLVAFTTIALGGFRGIIADILWLRASKLQEEGKYFELVQLADWITKLEPRFGAVWGFHAWNMAYNISVMFKNPDDRWRWVRNGISLIRDEGLRYNRTDAELYHELSWLYHHKIGGIYDTAHMYYKMHWSEEMTALLNGKAPDYDALLHIPNDREALLQDADVQSVVTELVAAGVDPFSVDLLDTSDDNASPSHAWAETPGGQRLLTYLRRNKLEKVYKLHVKAMQELEAYYGPLDWRDAHVHSLYWAEQGRPFAEGFDAVALERMACQSMAAMMKGGRYVVDPQSGSWISIARPELYDRAKKTFARARGLHPDVKTFSDAYRNFIRQAAVMMMVYNLRDQAARVHADYSKEFTDEEVPAELDRFIYETFLERSGQDLRTYLLATIREQLFESFRWIVLEDQQHAEGLQTVARILWRQYAEAHGSLPPNATADWPPFETLEDEARQQAYEVFDYPSARIRLDTASAP